MLYQLSYCPLRGAQATGGCRATGDPRTGSAGQRVSLCTVCLRSWLQYFFISRRSRSLTFDFIVM